MRLLPSVYFHVLPPAAALHKPPATILAHKGPIARVGAQVVLQALRRAQLLATFWTLHTDVQADRLILGLGVLWFMA